MLLKILDSWNHLNAELNYSLGDKPTLLQPCVLNNDINIEKSGL